MKLLVFAHTPPPHHGQSYMVQFMLNGFGGDRRKKRNRLQAPNPFGIECYHVNARLSKTLEDIGAIQSVKLLRLFLFCLQAIWCRFRYGVDNFYYVPAPGKRVALYRDWLVMFVCRPFFKRTILHWHAAGLAKWLETSVQIRTRAVTYHAFRWPALSVVISKYNVADAEKLLSRRICRVNYGIPDPCPEFEEAVLPQRKARCAARAKVLRNEPVVPADLERAGNLPAALEKYRAAVALLPDHVGIRVNFAVALLRLAEWQQGLAEMREAVRREPGNALWKAALDDALKQAPAEFGGQGQAGKSRKAGTKY